MRLANNPPSLRGCRAKNPCRVLEALGKLRKRRGARRPNEHHRSQ